jgi:hypothetical protein
MTIMRMSLYILHGHHIGNLTFNLPNYQYAELTYKMPNRSIIAQRQMTITKNLKNVVNDKHFCNISKIPTGAEPHVFESATFCF